MAVKLCRISTDFVVSLNDTPVAGTKTQNGPFNNGALSRYLIINVIAAVPDLRIVSTPPSTDTTFITSVILQLVSLYFSHLLSFNVNIWAVGTASNFSIIAFRHSLKHIHIL